MLVAWLQAEGQLKNQRSRQDLNLPIELLELLGVLTQGL